MMQDYGWYISVLGVLASQLPLHIAYLVGGIIALVRWKRHPRVSLFLLLSIAISFLTHIIVTVILLWLPSIMVSHQLSAREYGYISLGVNLAGYFFYTIAFCLLLAAVFTGRSSSANTNDFQDSRRS